MSFRIDGRESASGEMHPEFELDSDGERAEFRPHPQPVGLLGMVLLAVVGVGLAWLIATWSLPVAIASYQPDAALFLSSQSPTTNLQKALKLRSELHASLETSVDGDDVGQQSTLRPSADTAPQGSGKAGQRNDSAPANTQKMQGTASAAVPTEGHVPLSAEDRAQIVERQRIRHEMGEYANRVVSEDPLNPTAWRLLAEASDRPEVERSNLNRAVALSRLEAVAMYRLLNNALARKDFKPAMIWADMLVRKRPAIAPYVFAHLASTLDDANGRTALIETLKPELKWRTPFLTTFPRYLKSAEPAIELLVGLKNAGAPPTDEEMAPLLDLLIENKYVEFALGVWAQMLPPGKATHMGLLNNTSFEEEPSVLPFNWHLRNAPHAVTELIERVDKPKKRALRVTFLPGRGPFVGASQIIMLAPGKYQLSGVLRGEIVAKRGLKWMLRCRYGEKDIVAMSDALSGNESEWQRFTFDFSRGEIEDCNAQWLQLVLDARSPSEQFARGEILIDELKLVRTGDLDPVATDANGEQPSIRSALGLGQATGRDGRTKGLNGNFAPE